MDIPLDAELEARLNERARQFGVTPEALAVKFLRERLPEPLVSRVLSDEERMQSVREHEEMMQRIREIVGDTGVSLTDEQVSREHIYD